MIRLREVDKTFHAGTVNEVHALRRVGLEIADATFRPAVPAEYEGVALVQRAAAVKDAPGATPAAPATQK